LQIKLLENVGLDKNVKIKFMVAKKILIKKDFKNLKHI
jgi:hypothetical protein